MMLAHATIPQWGHSPIKRAQKPIQCECARHKCDIGTIIDSWVDKCGQLVIVGRIRNDADVLNCIHQRCVCILRVKHQWHDGTARWTSMVPGGIVLYPLTYTSSSIRLKLIPSPLKVVVPQMNWPILP
jgi:hypothetical protein